MSEGVYAEASISKKVHFGDSKKENIVDIYVSTESLRVYENPWVERKSPHVTGPAAQNTEIGNPVKRNRVRCDSVFLAVLCLTLLVGIIWLGVQMNKWGWERKQLHEENDVLRRMTERLKANNTVLSVQRDELWQKFCVNKWGWERKQLHEENDVLRRMTEQLKANNTVLSVQRDKLWQKFCG
ncbi:uncharacterized protein KZ484_024060 isoform 2-T4 [Pholidichthys leucotaenia]